MVRVGVLDDYQQVALMASEWSRLVGRAEITAFADHICEPDELVRRLEPFDVVVAMRERTPFPAAVLERLPRLRLLVTTGMRNASIDVAAARARGVAVCGTGASPTAAPEHSWALLMALARRIPAEDANLRAGRWQSTVGTELAGRTLGLLGLGRIGQRMARYARAFDMDIVAWSQNLVASTAEEHGARLVSKTDLFTEADVVSIHVQLSDRTRGIVGADELRLLGPAGLLVNTSRSPIVDEPALVSALRSGTIAGAALDVFDPEPLPLDNPLRTAPNTVLTPHLGYVTAETYARYFADAVADIEAWLDGRPVREL